MDKCRFQVRRTIIGLILVSFGRLEYAICAAVSNVALGKPATQTDTSGGANASLTVDGDTTTCSMTASGRSVWEVDLNDSYLIEEVSIHETISPWVTSVANAGPDLEFSSNVVGSNNNATWSGSWIYTNSCFTKKFLHVATLLMNIDAVRVHGIAVQSYQIAMGLTHGAYETEGSSAPSPATWRPSKKGPYRYVKIKATQQSGALALCEVQVKVPRPPYFSVFTDIAMTNPPVSTVSKVVSDIVCATICLRQTESQCMAAQFDQATKICALFNGYKHTQDSSNANLTVVCKWDAHFLATNN